MWLLLLLAAASLSAQTTSLPAAADTYLRAGAANQNQGTQGLLRVQQSGDNRALVRFDATAVAAAVGGGTLVSAHLELHVQAASGWGAAGRTLDLHRVTAEWTEAGATWNCPIDSAPANGQPNCPAQWAGGTFAEDAADSHLQTNDGLGTVRLDVTADVAAFLGGAAHHGWLLKRGDETAGGSVDVTSREGAAAQAPRLVLVAESAAVDEVAPRLAITAPERNPLVNDTTPAIAVAWVEGGSGVDAGSLVVTVDGAPAACTPGAASAACEAPPLAEGEHTIAASLSDLAGNEGTAERSFTLLVGPGLRSAAFGAVADAYVRAGAPNQNQGAEGLLRVRQSGRNRALVRFDGAALLAALGEGTLHSASLELTIADNGDNWGASGRPVDAHRLTAAWTEGGVTWNCPDDVVPGNAQANCPAPWAGGSFAAAPTASALHTNGQGGTVSYDVTADVAAFLAGTPDHGWLLKLADEGRSGRVEYAAREAGAAGAPRLVVSFEVPPGGEDTTPPVITAAAAPAANAAGWHRTVVTVIFTCSDLESGVASCPLPVAVFAEGEDQLVAGTATDQAGNTASVELRLHVDRTPPAVAVAPPPGGSAVGDPLLAITGTLAADLSGVAAVACDGAPATFDAAGFACEVTLEPGLDVVTVEAVDRAGNRGSAELAVRFAPDVTAPEVAILAPAAGSFVLEARPEIAVAWSDAGGADPATLAFTANGAPLPVDCELEAEAARCRPETDLPEAAVELVARVADHAGNIGAATAGFVVDIAELAVAVTSPANGFVTREEEVSVAGTVSAGAASVLVNGVPASLDGGSFTAIVPLRQGTNMVVALATKASGRTGTGSIQVTRDVIAPIVRIDSPRDGFVSVNDRVAVTGLVNDVVPGGTAAEVRVDGIEAEVGGGAFLVEEVELLPGPNTIEAVATDSVGNTGRHAIIVHFQPAVGARVVMESGNGQAAAVRLLLPGPLVARVVDELGNPLAGHLVRFQATRNNGLLRATAGDPPARVVQVPTDGSGRAGVLFSLGDTSGVGTNRVVATAVGVAGEVEFCASGLVGAPDKVLMTAGDNQRGVVGHPLPMPLEAMVVDVDGNPIPDVAVTFTVAAGTGHLDGAASAVRLTGLDGLARAVLTLGADPGINNNVVTAVIDGLEGLPATFNSSGLAPGDPADTRMSGVVLDNAHTPIPGSRVSIEGTPLETLTDERGQFTLAGVPVGHIHLIIEPQQSPRPEVFPPLAFETVTVAGQDNNLGQPILIPALDLSEAKIVGGPEDVTIKMPGVAGLELTVFANSATFPDGSRTGRLSITQVHLDKVPMPPPSGTFFMPPAWTVQPHGVHFDPPARIAIPNDGMPAGRMIDIYQFDHALNQFVNVGKGTTTEDGLLIVSDPGFGITSTGWGGCGQPPPPTTCADACGPCTKCNQATGKCEADPAKQNQPCDDQKKCTTNDRCQGEVCKGDPVEITEVKGMCVATVNQTVGYTATSNAASELDWLAPGGNPPTGTGGSFGTAFAGTGRKTVTAKCESTSKSTDTEVVRPCPPANTTPTFPLHFRQGHAALGPSEVGLTDAHLQDIRIATAVCLDGDKWKMVVGGLTVPIDLDIQLPAGITQIQAGPGGNTTAANYCQQVQNVIQLSVNRNVAGLQWFDLGLVEVHEQAHVPVLQAEFTAEVQKLVSDIDAAAVPVGDNQVCDAAAARAQIFPKMQQALEDFLSRTAQAHAAGLAANEAQAVAAETQRRTALIAQICTFGRGLPGAQPCAQCPP